MERLRTGILVEAEGKRGVTVGDMYGCCTDDETPVVWEGTNYGSGFPTEDLTVIGPENAKADMDLCGAGRGAQACIFLTISGNGPACARFGSLREYLIANRWEMVAKREPTELFPKCQLPPRQKGTDHIEGE